MPDLRTTADGIVLPVRARAGGRTNALQGVHDGCLRVSVTTAPERGKANAAIIKLLAGCLGLSKSQIRLLRGQTSPRKEFLVREIDQSELHSRIAVAIDRGR